jgi:uncharacterized protein (DUF697 family)/uncharacterized tellurite resistance protein B-like protein
MSMSTINQQELIASFKLLVQMAKADGKILPEEIANLQDSLAQVELPEGISIDGLLAEELDTKALLAQITSDTARELVYQSVFTMANIDGEVSPEEEALLKEVSQTFTSNMVIGKQGWLEELERKSRMGKYTIAGQLQQITDPVKRQNEVDKLTTDMCFINAVLGAFPLPLVSIAFDMLIYWNQLDLAQSIGEVWGYNRSREDLKRALLRTLGVTGVRIAVSNLSKMIIPLGMVVGATTGFASTWAIGKVADRYFASGCNLDAATLKQIFRTAQQEGQAKYREREPEITTKKQQVEADITRLSQQLRDGAITQEEYQAQLQKLLA